MPPFLPRRAALRYPWHDYADPGSVFVTICTEQKQPLFGEVVDGLMQHSPAGLAAIARWAAIPERFPAVGIDVFVVMPDHLHGIVMPGFDPEFEDPTASVGAVVRWFKTAVLADYRTGVREHGWPAYDGVLWQRRFHDRIIRSDREFNQKRAYIEGNPGRWWARTSGE